MRFLVGSGNIEKTQDREDIRELLCVSGEAPEGLGEGAAEDLPIKNENYAVVVRSELLKVLLKEGKFFITLLENFAWLTIKAHLSQTGDSKDGRDSENSKEPAFPSEQEVGIPF